MGNKFQDHKRRIQQKREHKEMRQQEVNGTGIEFSTVATAVHLQVHSSAACKIQQRGAGIQSKELMANYKNCNDHLIKLRRNYLSDSLLTSWQLACILIMQDYYWHLVRDPFCLLFWDTGHNAQNIRWIDMDHHTTGRAALAPKMPWKNLFVSRTVLHSAVMETSPLNKFISGLWIHSSLHILWMKNSSFKCAVPVHIIDMQRNSSLYKYLNQKWVKTHIRFSV